MILFAFKVSENFVLIFRFLSHPLSQVILADLWMGGLRMRKNPGFKIILGLLFPPTIAKLEFKTREELELMPQTEEELQVRFSDSFDDLKAAYTNHIGETSKFDNFKKFLLY